MEQIRKLAETKTVILISHRLANVAGADHIYVMENGCVVEDGTHEALLSASGAYEKLWMAQQELENYADGGRTDRKVFAADSGLRMTNGKEGTL
jgi:ATP-binding cassette subfamily C protein